MKHDGAQAVLNRLGLAYRAGKLVSGDESVLKAIRSGQAALVIVAADASANALKKYRDKCTAYGIPFVQFAARSELGASIGKPERVVLAVTDPGFAGLIRGSLQIPKEVKDIE
jgi:ribosomal protein L7Ae-like RNA K-turn-binding protein